MYKIYALIKMLFVLLTLTGCTLCANEPIPTKQKSSLLPSVHKRDQSTVIVLFNLGVDYKRALEIIHSYDMEVATYYKALSKQKGQVFMAIYSSKSSKAMIETLQKDSHIASVSVNYRRSLPEADK